MLVGDGEESLIVCLFPGCIGVMPRLFPVCSYVFQFLQFQTALFQQFLIDMLSGIYNQIQDRLLQNRQQVAADPISAHACQNIGPQSQRDSHGHRHRPKLSPPPLFRLKRIHPVLGYAEDKRGQSGKQRHAPVQPSCLVWVKSKINFSHQHICRRQSCILRYFDYVDDSQ